MMTSVKANYSRTRKTLPQGRKQRFLPAFRVDLPAHFRFAPTAIALDSKAGKIGFKSLDVCDIAITKDGLRSRELPSDELYRKAAAENDAGSLRIYPDVVFGGRRYVSLATRSASHDYAAANFRGSIWPFRQCEGKIREWRQSDHDDSRICLDGLDDRIGGGHLARSFTWRRIIVISESIAAMKPRCALMFAE